MSENKQKEAGIGPFKKQSFRTNFKMFGIKLKAGMGLSVKVTLQI